MCTHLGTLRNKWSSEKLRTHHYEQIYLVFLITARVSALMLYAGRNTEALLAKLFPLSRGRISSSSRRCPTSKKRSNVEHHNTKPIPEGHSSSHKPSSQSRHTNRCSKRAVLLRRRALDRRFRGRRRLRRRRLGARQAKCSRRCCDTSAFWSRADGRGDAVDICGDRGRHGRIAERAGSNSGLGPRAVSRNARNCVHAAGDGHEVRSAVCGLCEVDISVVLVVDDVGGP